MLTYFKGMNKKVSLLLIFILLTLCVCALVACNKVTAVDINFGYYFYSTSNNPADNARVNSSVWILLNPNKTWRASDNSLGVYEIKNTTVTLRKSTFATYMICNYDNGIMTVYSSDHSTEGIYLVQNETAERKNSSESSSFDLIETPEDLLTIDDSQSNATLSYALANDIDFTNFTYTTEIDQETGEEVTTILRTEIAPLFSDKNYAFSGILEGNGHKIKGLTIRADTVNGPKGLFAKTDGAIIRNLTLEDCELVQESGESIFPTGVLIGEAVDTSIEHVTIKGSLSYLSDNSPTESPNIIGGICGQIENSELTYCSFITTTTGGINKTNAQINIYNTQSYNMYIGGICGYAKGDCKFDQCYLNGNVYIQHEASDRTSAQEIQSVSIFGGILGNHDGSNNLTLMNCFVEVSRVSHRFVNKNTHGKVLSNVYLGGIVGHAMVNGNIDVTIHNCALVGALVEDAEVNKDSLLVNVGGICGLSNADLYYSYRDGSINVRAATKSPVSTDSIEVNIGGLSTQSALDGCFVTGGTIIGTLIVDKESAVTRNNCRLNILIMTMTDQINNSLFDESYLDTEERRMVGIFNYKDAANPFTGQIYKEIRNTTLDNTTLTSYASTQLKPYNLTTINQSNISAVFKTLYLLGFKQYKNVVDITKNPENAWNIVAGYLPRLFWI